MADTLNRVILYQRMFLGHAVNGRGANKDDTLDAALLGLFKRVAHTIDIGGVDFLFRPQRQSGGAMDDGIDLIIVNQPIHAVRIADILVHQQHVFGILFLEKGSDIVQSQKCDSSTRKILGQVQA